MSLFPNLRKSNRNPEIKGQIFHRSWENRQTFQSNNILCLFGFRVTKLPIAQFNVLNLHYNIIQHAF